MRLQDERGKRLALSSDWAVGLPPAETSVALSSGATGNNRRRLSAVAASPLAPSKWRGIPTTRDPRPEDALSEINWAAELKKIEREFDGLPPEPSPASSRAKMEWGRREEEQRQQRRGAIGVYIRLALVVALVISIGSWPYVRSCGMSLFLYMASVSAVIIGGVWIAVSTWLNRMPRTHLLAIFIVFWGLTLSAVEVLPRAGYAQPDPQREVWSCG